MAHPVLHVATVLEVLSVTGAPDCVQRDVKMAGQHYCVTLVSVEINLTGIYVYLIYIHFLKRYRRY